MFGLLFNGFHNCCQRFALPKGREFIACPARWKWLKRRKLLIKTEIINRTMSHQTNDCKQTEAEVTMSSPDFWQCIVVCRLFLCHFELSELNPNVNVSKLLPAKKWMEISEIAFKSKSCPANRWNANYKRTHKTSNKIKNWTGKSWVSYRLVKTVTVNKTIQ